MVPGRACVKHRTEVAVTETLVLSTHIEHKAIVLNPHWVSLHHGVGFHLASLGRTGEMLSHMGTLVYPSSRPACAYSFSRPQHLLPLHAIWVSFICLDPLLQVGEPQTFFTNIHSTHPQPSLKALEPFYVLGTQ